MTIAPLTPRVLFVFAHQDDEYFAAPWILQELSSGSRLACIYCTDGGIRGDPAGRDRESVAVLRSLGVPDGCTAFLQPGGQRIPDQQLMRYAGAALGSAQTWMQDNRFSPDRVYAPSYEGGHPDHDAAHIIAAVIASKRGIVSNAWHFALYNGYRRPRPFFATMRQLPTERRIRRARMSFATRWQIGWLFLRYRSQRRTFLGLLPGILWRRMLRATEAVVAFDLSRLLHPPHEGTLLYERMFGITHSDFLREMRTTLEEIEAQ